MWKIQKISQFKKQVQRIVLDAQQKDMTRENILAYMQTHPVRKSVSKRLKLHGEKNILFFNMQHMYAKIATILILLSGTGTAFAAENTVPGDTLYPVKVHVNEPVRGILAVSPEAKAHWDAQLAERRLDEASKLATHGKLTAEIETRLESKFAEQTQKVKDRISKLQEAGKNDIASELSTRLESALQIHSQILDTLSTATDTPKQDIKPLLKELKEEVESMKEIKIKMNDENKKKSGLDVKVAAENHMNMALKQITRVKELLTSKNVSSTSSASIKLEEAQKAYDEGKKFFDAENYSEAFIAFGNAQRLAAEARIVTHVEHDLKIDEQMHKILEKIDEKKLKIEDRLQKNLEIETKLKEKVLDQKEKFEEKIKNRLEKFSTSTKDHTSIKETTSTEKTEEITDEQKDENEDN